VRRRRLGSGVVGAFRAKPFFMTYSMTCLRTALVMLLAVGATLARAADPLTREAAVVLARKAAEPKLTAAYARWCREVTKGQSQWQPPKRDGPWLEAEPETVEPGKRPGSWHVRWRHEPPAGWTWIADVDVDAAGKARVRKAEASFPPE
jgi:hypothetical protein